MMTPAKLLEELLRLRSSPVPATAELASHNHDDLCRLVADRIGTLLGSFEKYQHISYILQGPRDQGVDVLLKGSVKEDEPDKFHAIQVKSYKELGDKDSDLAKQLKAGLYDARQAYPALERYYILLFGDAKLHAKRLSAITNEFARDPLVRVIGPRELHAYLQISDATLFAVVDRHLGDEDYVRRKAREEVADLNRPMLHFLLACLCWAFENATDQLPERFLEKNARLRDLVDEYGSDALDDALIRFEDSDIEIYAVPSSMRVRVEHFPAVRALYFDLQVRYEEDPDELFEHLMEFLLLS